LRVKCDVCLLLNILGYTLRRIRYEDSDVDLSSAIGVLRIDLYALDTEFSKSSTHYYFGDFGINIRGIPDIL
jgi:hypothetical protein